MSHSRASEVFDTYDARSAVEDILSSNFLLPEDLATKGLTARSVGGDSRVFLVCHLDGSGFALKRQRTEDERRAMAQEREFGRWLRGSGLVPDQFEALPGPPLLLPSNIPAEPDSFGLSRVPPGATPLVDALDSFETHDLLQIVSDLGKLMATVHELSGEFAEATKGPRAPMPLALYLSPLELGAWSQASLANLDLIDRVRGDPLLSNAIGRLANEWSFLAPIHGDLKPTNVIVSNPHSTSDPWQVSLIDFELSGFGMPGWDLALFVASLMRHWFSGLPLIDPSLDKSALDDVSITSSSLVSTLILTFLSAYTENSPTRRQTDYYELLLYLPATLLQVAWEVAQPQQEINTTALFCISAASQAAADLNLFLETVFEA